MTDTQTNYWCYILSSYDNKIINTIIDESLIIFPNRNNIIIGDIVIMYAKHGKSNRIGFYGYAQISSIIEKHKKDIDCFRAIVKHRNILGVPIRKKQLLDGHQNYVQIDNEIRKIILNDSDSCVHISSEIGQIIRELLRKHAKQINQTEQVKTDTCVHNIEISKSKFLIPIIIVPCETCKTKTTNMTSEKCIDYIFSHIALCRKCDITNNNERVSIDMLYGMMVSFYVISNETKIDKILYAYHTQSYYVINEQENDSLRLIKINDKNNDYYECFCIVGKLKHAY